MEKSYTTFTFTLNYNRFRRFVGRLQPLYKLPSRQVLYDSHLTTQYARAMTERRSEVAQATAVCVSAEGWLSQANERYVALTAHYLSPQLEPKSCLLDCFMYTDHHTADAVRDELTRIVDEWSCQGKVCLWCALLIMSYSFNKS